MLPNEYQYDTIMTNIQIVSDIVPWKKVALAKIVLSKQIAHYQCRVVHLTLPFHHSWQIITY